MKNHTYRYYDLILALFAACLLISNLAATKLVAFGPIITDGVAFGPIITDGGVILFPLVYIFGDVLTEVYGYKYARRAIWTGFGIMLLAVLAFTIVRYMPPAADYPHQASFEAVLGFLPQIVLASLLAYLVGEFINSYVLAKLKIKTKGKLLWLRLISSTFLGQIADTIIFAIVAFGGALTGMNMLNYIAVGLGLKTGAEILLLPLTYRVINFLKKREGVDAYDTKTDFTPTKASL